MTSYESCDYIFYWNLVAQLLQEKVQQVDNCHGRPRRVLQEEKFLKKKFFFLKVHAVYM